MEFGATRKSSLTNCFILQMARKLADRQADWLKNRCQIMGALLLDVCRLNNWKWQHGSTQVVRITCAGFALQLIQTVLSLSKAGSLLSCWLGWTATINHLRRKIKSISQVGVVRCQLTYPRVVLVQTLWAYVLLSPALFAIFASFDMQPQINKSSTSPFPFFRTLNRAHFKRENTSAIPSLCIFTLHRPSI